MSDTIYYTTGISQSYKTREVDLGELNEKERTMGMKFLIEEADVFCEETSDIGNVKNCQMKVILKNETPNQKTSYSMHKPLHVEVKNYVEDLLNYGWIRNSKSHYSSPIVVFQKKDGGLRLCYSCRALNGKTRVDSDPQGYKML